MNVRAKVKCVAIDPAGPDNNASTSSGGSILFEPAPTSFNEQAGEKFHTYCLEGALQLFTLNVASLDQCEVGKEYYVEVSPVEAAAVQQPRTVPGNLPDDQPASLAPGMSEQEVVTLMESSTSEAEWNRNSDHVLRMCGGYPAFWQTAIVGSGLYRRVKSSFETNRNYNSIDTTDTKE